MKEKEEKNVEFVNQQEEVGELRKYSVKEFISGRLLSRERLAGQLPFVFFLFFLAVFYIANRYHAERLLRESSKLQEELSELRAESITTASELMFASRQSQVFKAVQEKGLGLKESRTPPTRIKE
jgi:hypothetical protein